MKVGVGRPEAVDDGASGHGRRQQQQPHAGILVECGHVTDDDDANRRQRRHHERCRQRDQMPHVDTCLQPVRIVY